MLIRGLLRLMSYAHEVQYEKAWAIPQKDLDIGPEHQ